MTKEEAIEFGQRVIDCNYKDDSQAFCKIAVKALKDFREWIPSAERQPDKNGNYLVTYESSDGTATLRYEAVEHYGPDWLHESKHEKVVAWMPLPEKYLN